MLSRNEKVFRFRDLLGWELGQSVLGVSNMVVPQVVSQIYLLQLVPQAPKTLVLLILLNPWVLHGTFALIYWRVIKVTVNNQVYREQQSLSDKPPLHPIEVTSPACFNGWLADSVCSFMPSAQINYLLYARHGSKSCKRNSEES